MITSVSLMGPSVTHTHTHTHISPLRIVCLLLLLVVAVVVVIGGCCCCCCVAPKANRFTAETPHTPTATASAASVDGDDIDAADGDIDVYVDDGYAVAREMNKFRVIKSCCSLSVWDIMQRIHTHPERHVAKFVKKQKAEVSYYAQRYQMQEEELKQ